VNQKITEDFGGQKCTAIKMRNTLDYRNVREREVYRR
jgi:hypothetical protein